MLRIEDLVKKDKELVMQLQADDKLDKFRRAQELKAKGIVAKANKNRFEEEMKEKLGAKKLLQNLVEKLGQEAQL